MLTVVKRELSPEEIKRWLATVSGFIQAATRMDDKPTKLYDYQIEFNECKTRFREVLKSRQTGFSFDLLLKVWQKLTLRLNIYCYFCFI